MRRRAQSGITLLELLIAVTLVSLLSVGMLMAMRVGFNAMQKTNNKLMANRRVAGVERILAQQVAGLMPVTATCGISSGSPPTPAPFFQGDIQGMRFVSNYSLDEATRGYPRILEYLVIPGADGRGVRLVVNEHLYSGPLSTGFFCVAVVPDPQAQGMVPRFREIQPSPASFVLADKLAGCRFLYRDFVLGPGNQPLERWIPHWVKREWPTAIRIEMAPLDPNAANLQVSSVTIPVRVNREPFKRYED